MLTAKEAKQRHAGGFIDYILQDITLGSIIVSIWRYGWKAMGSSDSGF